MYADWVHSRWCANSLEPPCPCVPAWYSREIPFVCRNDQSHFTLQALLVCSSQASRSMVQSGALHVLLPLACGPVSTAPS